MRSIIYDEGPRVTAWILETLGSINVLLLVAVIEAEDFAVANNSKVLIHVVDLRNHKLPLPSLIYLIHVFQVLLHLLNLVRYSNFTENRASFVLHFIYMDHFSVGVSSLILFDQLANLLLELVFVNLFSNVALVNFKCLLEVVEVFESCSELLNDLLSLFLNRSKHVFHGVPLQFEIFIHNVG